MRAVSLVLCVRATSSNRMFTGVFSRYGLITRLALSLVGLLVLCIDPTSLAVFWVDVTIYALVALIPWDMVLPMQTTGDNLHSRGCAATFLHLFFLFPLGSFLLLRAHEMGRWQQFLLVILIQHVARRCYNTWNLYWDTVTARMKSSC